MRQEWADGKQEKSPGQEQVTDHLYCTAGFLLKLCCLSESSKDGGNAANKMDLEFIYSRKRHAERVYHRGFIKPSCIYNPTAVSQTEYLRQ